MWIFGLFNHTRRKFRYFIRRHMKPIPVDEAEERREFFAKLYFLSALATFTYLVYGSSKTYTKENRGTKLAEGTVERLKMDGNVRILTIEGFKKKEDYYFTREGGMVDTNEKSDVELVVEPEPKDQLKVLDYS